MNQNPVFVVPIIAVAANVVTFFDDADILVTALGQLTGYYSAGETAAYNNTIVHSMPPYDMIIIVYCKTQKSPK